MLRSLIILALFFVAYSEPRRRCVATNGNTCEDDIPYLRCELEGIPDAQITSYVKCSSFVERGYCAKDPTLYSACCKSCQKSNGPPPAGQHCGVGQENFLKWIRTRNNDCSTAHDIFGCSSIAALSNQGLDILSVGCRRSWVKFCERSITAKDRGERFKACFGANRLLSDAEIANQNEV